MFSYLRYFSVISLVVITIAAGALGYYFRNTAGDDLRDLVLKNNKVLVQGFINNLWKKHRMVEMLRLFYKHNIPESRWNRYRGYEENYKRFQLDVFKYFEEMPIVQVNIYTANGNPLISLNQARMLDPEITEGIQVPDRAVLQAALAAGREGNTASALIENAKFELASGSIKEGTLMQTVVPIMSDNYVPLVADAAYDKSNNVQGMVEVFYDISRQWDQVYNFQYIGTGGIIVIFLTLIGALIFIASKAEAIITKQHEANLELAAQASAAEAENKNKSQFLANISHELRTPLNAIIGFSEILKTEALETIPNEQHRSYITDIHNSGVHLLSLINDILDYSKAEAGKLELTMEEVDITKLITSSMRLVSPRAEQAQVKLISAIPKEHYIIYTDAKKFKQIMLNLLSNAVKFTPPGGEVTVTLWQNVVDNSISVEVKDTGIGIAPKDISRALAPFGQVDSALSRKYEGTGLGLPLTKKFIEIMGGSFYIQSEENVGTSVSFSLPIRSKEEIEPQNSKPKTTANKQQNIHQNNIQQSNSQTQPPNSEASAKITEPVRQQPPTSHTTGNQNYNQTTYNNTMQTSASISGNQNPHTIPTNSQQHAAPPATNQQHNTSPTPQPPPTTQTA